jgi:hypothetical protein
MTTTPNKKYLSIAKRTRGILDADVPVSVDTLHRQIPPISKIRSKKEAYATTAFWLAVARSNGEPIQHSHIVQLLNKLKGKNSRSRNQIRQILATGMQQIRGANPATRKVRKILSGMEQDGMVESVAETVVNALVKPSGSTNAMTSEQSGSGWAKFALAVLVVLIAKFSAKR